jgi:hypothetical protein
MNETRALARFVAETCFDDLPRGLVDNCKITVLELAQLPTIPCGGRLRSCVRVGCMKG